tara:strand:+ start:275 stop:436 length:162 start_codon:yes stop_codon:yes gene_type:complete
MDKIKDTIELLPDDRPWEYDCDGTKTHKGDFTKRWSDEDEQLFVEKYNNKKTH